jgi:hypothetical protein
MESAVTLATEVCFCGESPEIRPFSAASSVVPQIQQNQPGFSPCNRDFFKGSSRQLEGLHRDGIRSAAGGQQREE